MSNIRRVLAEARAAGVGFQWQAGLAFFAGMIVLAGVWVVTP